MSESMVRCIDCASFSFKRAHPEMARTGKGACAHHIPRLAYDAMTERDCAAYLKAAPGVIAKRELWMAEVKKGASHG